MTATIYIWSWSPINAKKYTTYMQANFCTPQARILIWGRFWKLWCSDFFFSMVARILLDSSPNRFWEDPKNAWFWNNYVSEFVGKTLQIQDEVVEIQQNSRKSRKFMNSHGNAMKILEILQIADPDGIPTNAKSCKNEKQRFPFKMMNYMQANFPSPQPKLSIRGDFWKVWPPGFFF